ncbi:MAG: DUF1697 domain-containing protein [Chloracidobacterium sp.]|nr:DUF1697 domain-containing protein [Chloracidobacterium sp.]
MPRYIALLRGINVTGNAMIRMEELRGIFEALGFSKVATYINSGNVGFDCRNLRVGKGVTPSLKLEEKIETAVEKHMGRPVAVMVRERSHIECILANNPFDGEFESHKEMHVLFMKQEASREQLVKLRDAAPAEERFAAKGGEIYLHLPMGVAQSLLGRGLIEKKLKIAVTARNWRTVQKLAEL